MPRLLIVHHTQSGNTGRLAEAVLRGAQVEPGVDTVMKRAFDTTLDDLLNCNGLLLGTPENFGFMSGALKDFFDRTYYPAEGKTLGLPYAVFISAGNDGRGAVRQIERIATGIRRRARSGHLLGHDMNLKALPGVCRNTGDPSNMFAYPQK